MAAVMFRGRSLRGSRQKGRPENNEELVKLDYTKESGVNLQEVLVHIVKPHGVSKGKRLGYYNAFVRLCHRCNGTFLTSLTRAQIISCLRVGLFHSAKEVRAASLRALRYYLRDETTLDAFLQLHTDYLVIRSLDICLANDIERIHALRLIRRIMHISPKHVASSLVNVMVSIANDGVKEKDKMVKTCLATLCELAFLNPSQVSRCGGTSAILHSVLDCHQLPRINESLIATILHLLNHPSTRHLVHTNTDLEQVLAPFTDLHFRYSASTSEQNLKEERENRFIASKMAIATIIKSWPGMMRFCKPDGSGLHSLLGVLYLPQMETRKEIMDVLFEVFRLQVPVWTDNFREALISVDPSQLQESWRLREGFVAEEGKAILPHLAKTRPNLVDNHMALILSVFISAGILEALITVLATSEDFVSVRATILLGELLHLSNTIIPYENSSHSHCLPTLVTLASCADVNSAERNRAKMAITCLSRQHALKKRGAVPCSLFLDQIVRQSSGGALAHPGKVSNEKLLQCLTKDAEQEMLMQSLRDSLVLSTRSPIDWDWELISAILKWPDSSFLKLEEQQSQRFLKKLLYFFKPMSKLFSNIETSTEDHRRYTLAALNLVDFLLESEDDEAPKHIEEWLKDIAIELSKVRSPHAPHDVLFSPACLMNTLSQHYFLIIGRFSASPVGDKFLESTGIYQYLLDIVTISNHDTYIKVIVSSLDYTCDGMTRIILSKALTATSEAARLYTASFMRVLLRARVPFLSNWGMEMLVMQLYDQSKPVAMEALSVISEACEEEVNLHTLVNMRPSVLHLGYKGALLLARFLSIPAGYKFLCDTNYVSHELDKWHKSFNMKYVEIVDEQLNEALTTYEKTYDGSYTRRSARRQPRKDVFVPIHLYGQLVQHKNGFELLRQQKYIHEYFDRIQLMAASEDFQALKAALWVVGHIGTSLWGLGMLEETNIIPYIIKHAEENNVFSIRGTAYYVLGLIAATSKGADLLAALGWESVRHQRSELWPVIENEEANFLAVQNSGDAPVGSSTISLTHSEPGGRGAYWSNHSPNSFIGDMNHVSHSPKDHAYFGGQEHKRGKVRGETTSSVESISNKVRGDTSSSVESISNKIQGSGSNDSLPQKIPLIVSDSSSKLELDVNDMNQPSLSKERTDTMGTEDSLVLSEYEMGESKWRSNTSETMSTIDRWCSDAAGTVENRAEMLDDYEENKLRCSSNTSDGIVFTARSRTGTSASSPRLMTSEDEDVFPEQPPAGAASNTSGVSGSGQSSELSDSDGFHTPGMRTSVSPPMLNGALPTGKASDSSLDSSTGKLDVPSVVKFKLVPERKIGRAPMSAPPNLDPPKFPTLEAGPRDHRGERSGSNESSHTSKSHSDSIGTDNTSGVSSFDSGQPSDDNTLGSCAITPGAKDPSLMGHGSLPRTPKSSEKPAHPSDTLRAQVNLKRIPDLDGRFSNISRLSPLKNLGARHMSESMLATKLSRDNLGYATFRDLQRTRMLNTDFGVDFLAPTMASPGISKTKSLDFRLGKAGTPNTSYTSLSGGDASSAPTTPYSTLPRSISSDKVPKMLPPAIRAEYIGITLPVDVSMMFQLQDVDITEKSKENKIPEIRMEQTKTHVKHLSRSISEANCDNGLEMHTKLNCLGCYSVLKPEERTVLISGATESESELLSSDQYASDCDTRNTTPSTYGGASPADATIMKDLKASSPLEVVLPGSVTSNTSLESSTKPLMSEESEAGRILIRKEILRMIVALSSSVGVKSSEQGLLILKQQYNKSFHDLCLYSEVCMLLANYNYRLAARRFIQELFQDVSFETLMIEPYEVLEIDPEEGKETEDDDGFFRLEDVPESLA